ncbi:protein of unknown function [Ralstonia solanacearum CMR15]|nr:protein of unknown function [Ralstonia solanacearum CMR15]
MCWTTDYKKRLDVQRWHATEEVSLLAQPSV